MGIVLYYWPFIGESTSDWSIILTKGQCAGPLVIFLLARTNHWTKNGVVGWLTHWGRVTHICVSNLTIVGSDNGLLPDRRQAIIWTNAGILSIGPLGINFNENLIGIQTFLFYKMHLKMSSAKWRPFCLGLNVLKTPLGSCDVSAILLATCSPVYKICNVSTNTNI